jgi:hypothetical protein
MQDHGVDGHSVQQSQDRVAHFFAWIGGQRLDPRYADKWRACRKGNESARLSVLPRLKFESVGESSAVGIPPQQERWGSARIAAYAAYTACRDLRGESVALAIKKTWGALCPEHRLNIAAESLRHSLSCLDENSKAD